MTDITLKLGRHTFTVSQLSYSRLQRDFNARWKEHYTAGGGHVDQFLGPSAREMSIDGALFPAHVGDLEPALALGWDIEKGAVMRLMSQSGEYFGTFKGISMNIQDETIGPNGIVMEGRYAIKLSSHSGKANQTQMMSANGIVTQIAKRIRETLF